MAVSLFPESLLQQIEREKKDLIEPTKALEIEKKKLQRERKRMGMMMVK